MEIKDLNTLFSDSAKASLVKSDSTKFLSGEEQHPKGLFMDIFQKILTLNQHIQS